MSAALEHPNYTIRTMKNSDLDAVMGIELDVYSFPWSKQIFTDCMRVGYHCLVITLDEELLGYAIMSAAAGEAHLLNLCIKKQHQRSGLGKLLLRHSIKLAESKKVQSLFLEVRPSNNAALKLYEKLGFNQIGTRKDYYPAKSGREDAIILALTLLN